ncbi:MAG: hypothetical protein IK143_05515 [Bacteroidales bacterium]|nr:hypothetical protein [Bacteroidales bacterium]
MKKILLAIAIMASIMTANAQSKAAADARKAVDAAEAAAQNPKKATKAATWLKLGQAYYNAYNAPTANVVGNNKQELQLLMGNDKPISTEVVTVKDAQLEKNVYSDKNLYFDNNGILQITEVTAPVYEFDPLEKSLAAYKKAVEIDPSKTKDTDAAIAGIAQAYFQAGYNQYALGNSEAACRLFGKAAYASEATSAHQIDTTAIYYAGVTAVEAADYPAAKEYFEKALSVGYEGDNGSVIAYLSTVSLSQKDTTLAKSYLETGFQKYPESGMIMTNLINVYLATKEDPAKLIELLGEAKKQMPDNGSLYFVEGNLLKELKRTDDAIAAYRQAAVVDPSYEMGYYGEGTILYEKAVAMQEEAEALDIREYKKYDELIAQRDEILKSAIAPFEKAFEVSSNNDVKMAAATYLKNIFYMFRNEADNQTKYDKYDSFLKGE